MTSTFGRKSHRAFDASVIALCGEARFSRPTKRPRDDARGVSRRAGAIPGLRPVERAEQHQAQRRAVGRARPAAARRPARAKRFSYSSRSAISSAAAAGASLGRTRITTCA